MSKLRKLGDPLEKLNRGVDFEIFRSLLEEKLTIEPKGVGGRQPYDYVLMFKVMNCFEKWRITDSVIFFRENA